MSVGSTNNPIIGQDIPWTTVDGHFLRVLDVAYLGTVKETKVAGPPVPLPYAVATVESPVLKGRADLPITHKLDFRHLWEALKVRGLADGEECLIAREQRKGWFSKALPTMHIRITGAGQLEKMYDPSTPATDRGGQNFAKWSPSDH
ncbi:MAG: hypothetical protein HY678_07035 [Chloroflexi bacterium]|nr:hypothetical protein [Chloroflexota bacterium]